MSVNCTTELIISKCGLEGDPKYWSAIIIAIRGFSLPLRKQLLSIVEAYLVQIDVLIRTQIASLKKYDILSAQLEIIRGVITTALLPVDTFLNNMPVDQAVFEVPEIADLFREVIEFIPITIPAMVSETLPSFLGTEIFEGVSSFKDLKDKLDSYIFRLSRVLSLREAANSQLFTLYSYTDKYTKYKDIIISLNACN